MKKTLKLLLLLTLLFLVSFKPLTVFANELPQSVKVTHTVARVFSHTNNLETLTQEELAQATIKILYLNDVVSVTGEIEEFYIVEVEMQNSTTATGYIYKTVVINNAFTSPEKFLQTNAKLVENSFTFENNNEVYTKLENEKIEKNTRVRILNGYKTNRKYTQISYNKNGQIITTYIETKNLKTDGIDRSILLAITLITISVGAGSILLKIFKRKNKN